ncbi:MAG: hypothetical protein JST17_05820 [Bacteroidetes bacterium]|nr:hypothetical protein [Bacteroidota bacterium]MBS1929925.1 hypothetical protein [Bacteroidota bacterium]
MEVHHHHHEPHSHKKWHHYFWEFLMLFLAVFCGFLAENFREHQVEHQREKRYMENLIQDLSRDTATIADRNAFQKRAVIYADSLVFLVNSAEKSTYLSEIYYYARILAILKTYQYSNATVTQLKNSGSLRLIRKEFIADSILQYDMRQQQVLTVDANITETLRDFRVSMSRVFDALTLRNMIDLSNMRGEKGFGEFVTKPQKPTPLITEDKTLINELCMNANFLMTLYQNELKVMSSLANKATRLIELIKKEYHLE